MNENKINFSPLYKLSCLNCPFIPKIKLNSKQHSINIECHNNLKIDSSSNIISAHINDKIPLKDYLLKIQENEQKHCRFCEKNDSLDTFYYCIICDNYICEKCLTENHLNEKSGHPVLKLNCINTSCIIHYKNNKYYCKNCARNICEYCLKISKNHKNHEIINFENIKIDDNYLKDINKEIDNEEKNTKNLFDFFNDYTKLTEKKLIEYSNLRKDEIELKKNIVNTYENNKNNYNSIENLKKLKFDYFQINEDKMHDLDEKEINLNKLKNFKNLIEELIFFEENKMNKIEGKANEKNKDDINNKEIILLNKELKCIKYEIVNKIDEFKNPVDKVVYLKWDKILFAFNNRMLVIYNINKFNNLFEKLCELNLSNYKPSNVKNNNFGGAWSIYTGFGWGWNSNFKSFKGIYQLKNENLLVSMNDSHFILNVDYKTKNFSLVQLFNINMSLRINNPFFSNLSPNLIDYNDIFPTNKNEENINNYNLYNNNWNFNHNNNIKQTIPSNIIDNNLQKNNGFTFNNKTQNTIQSNNNISLNNPNQDKNQNLKNIWSFNINNKDKNTNTNINNVNQDKNKNLNNN